MHPEYLRHEMVSTMFAGSGTRLWREARNCSLCADDADDALQQAMVIALEKLPLGSRTGMNPAPAGRAGKLPRAWLARVVRNEALAVRAARTRLMAGGELDAVRLDLMAGDCPDPAEAVEGMQRTEYLRSLVDGLRPAERRALVLQAGGYSYAEIRQITGWTYTKVNRSLVRGRDRLRTGLAAFD